VTRLEEDVEAEEIGDLSTVDGLLDYLGLKGKPIETQRDVVQAFITGAEWARPVLVDHIVELRERGLID
jgi:hypothetical protein